MAMKKIEEGIKKLTFTKKECENTSVKTRLANTIIFLLSISFSEENLIASETLRLNFERILGKVKLQNEHFCGYANTLLTHF